MQKKKCFSEAIKLKNIAWTLHSQRKMCVPFCCQTFQLYPKHLAIIPGEQDRPVLVHTTILKWAPSRAGVLLSEWTNLSVGWWNGECSTVLHHENKGAGVWVKRAGSGLQFSSVGGRVSDRYERWRGSEVKCGDRLRLWASGVWLNFRRCCNTQAAGRRLTWTANSCCLSNSVELSSPDFKRLCEQQLTSDSVRLRLR